jgi:squalene-hopene/tetraprenyl-beta-curcumene cyclase
MRQDHIVVIVGVALGVAGCSRTMSTPANPWDPKAAAAYLDRRMEWWMGWKASSRDRGTFCVSCHTAMPYALARPSLRPAFAAGGPATDERKLIDNVTARVRLWNQTQPFYTDEKFGPNKSAQSRGTEAVLNALILASDDARSGNLGGDTGVALENMWGVQHASGDDSGAWSWLDFDLAPWEIPEAGYYGACLAAMAVGAAPERYQTRPQIQGNLSLLRGYLERNFAAQSLHNRLVLLWASSKLDGLVAADRRAAIIKETLRAQDADGGWSLSGLISQSVASGLLRDPQSDGYATGLVVLVLQRTAMPGERTSVQRGLSWLEHNQHAGGFWVATSLNKRRNLSSPVAWFMRDAATAYAVLALSESPDHRKRPQ